LEWWLTRTKNPHQGKLPIFYHFHTLRIYQSHISLWAGYFIGKKARTLIYSPYLNRLFEIFDRCGDKTKFSFSKWVVTTERNYFKRLWIHLKHLVKLLISRTYVIEI